MDEELKKLLTGMNVEPDVDNLPQFMYNLRKHVTHPNFSLAYTLLWRLARKKDKGVTVK